MEKNNWVHVIIRALHELGGSAPYSRLKPTIERRNEKSFTPKWHQTVEGTVEEYSSDSIRGNKPIHFAGSEKDVFQKVGHGHWKIRDLNNRFVREALDLDAKAIGTFEQEQVTSESFERNLVFVREHFRNFPGDGDDNNFERLDLSDAIFQPTAAWCTNLDLEVELQSGVIIRTPLWWYPRLLAATPQQRASVRLSALGMHWEEIDEDLSVAGILRGAKAPKAVPPG